MLVLEFKTYGKSAQFNAVDEAIRVTQFIRNKSIRLWMDGQAKSWVELSRHCSLLAKEFDFANKLNSMARQAAAERAWETLGEMEPLLELAKACLSKHCRRTKNPRSFRTGSVNTEDRKMEDGMF